LIPVKLRLRNFMCYGDNVSPLSFEGIHVACLCGDNGSGKSALLDAITWALWGKSRADSDDDLVRQGQTDVEVDLEFSTRGQLYRVLRKHSRGQSGRSGSTLLTLQSISDGSSRDISGNTKTETQQKLVEVLHLDYKTFRNSAYLVQGRANEFTVADPVERKRVLAAILELSQYDELCELARMKALEKSGHASRLQEMVTSIDTELAGKQQCQADLGNIQSLLSSAEAERLEAEQAFSALQQTLKELEIKQNQLKDMAARQNELRTDLNRWERRAGELSQRIQGYREVEAGRAEIEQGHKNFVGLDSENNRLNEKAQQLLGLQAAASRIEMAIERAQNILVNEHRNLQKSYEDNSSKANNLGNLERELSHTEANLKALLQTEEAIQGKRHRLSTLVAQIENLKAQNETLLAGAKQLEEKLNMLASPAAKCPLCETELGLGGIERVRNNYRAERDETLQTLRSNRSLIEGLSVERRSLESELSRIEPVLRTDKAAKQNRLGRLEKDIADARVASEAAAEEKVQIAELEQRMTTRDFAPTEHKSLAEVRAQVAALAYDPAKHQEVKSALKDASIWETGWTRLEEASKELPRLTEEHGRVRQTTSEIGQRILDERQRIEALAKELAELPRVQSENTKSRALLENLARSEKSLREQLAVVRERLRRCEQLEKDREGKVREITSALTEESLYRQLSEAFGKKGIQALLIEQALPQIREEADRLLKKLTDNRMSIAINTQKETKKGTVVETLDIQVSDELGGTRNYEMFSGGEAFRIDFALRIALSRLMTYRSGSSLSTLFIDEGFGTQDASGREKLVEVINSVQNEFDKIIVITHLEELKEAFPSRIEVSRSPTGSVISLN